MMTQVINQFIETDLKKYKDEIVWEEKRLWFWVSVCVCLCVCTYVFLCLSYH
jgi:hypothetical protein